MTFSWLKGTFRTKSRREKQKQNGTIVPLYAEANPITNSLNNLQLFQ